MASKFFLVPVMVCDRFQQILHFSHQRKKIFALATWLCFFSWHLHSDWKMLSLEGFQKFYKKINNVPSVFISFYFCYCMHILDLRWREIEIYEIGCIFTKKTFLRFLTPFNKIWKRLSFSFLKMYSYMG